MSVWLWCRLKPLTILGSWSVCPHFTFTRRYLKLPSLSMSTLGVVSRDGQIHFLCGVAVMVIIFFQFQGLKNNYVATGLRFSFIFQLFWYFYSSVKHSVQGILIGRCLYKENVNRRYIQTFKANMGFNYVPKSKDRQKKNQGHQYRQPSLSIS